MELISTRRGARAGRQLVVAFSILAVSASPHAANRCVNAKGKTLPLSACADASLPPAEPGTYSTLAQRPAAGRGPKAKVYESNPGHHADSQARLEAARQDANPVNVPMVIELSGASAGTSATTPVRAKPGSPHPNVPSR